MRERSPIEGASRPRRVTSRLVAVAFLALIGCEGEPPQTVPAAVPTANEPSPEYRSIGTGTAYVGDDACAPCHADVNDAYAPNAMARSFHRWTSGARTETTLTVPLLHEPTGLHYAVVEREDGLYQVEYVLGPTRSPLHQLERRMDWVMGSGAVARTYFTEENGRLFQLPLTWYADQGWDFSPGYELNNPRFSRMLPDGCVACHGSYPERLPYLEGKYAELTPGIGCERCHGPGALHVEERAASTRTESADERAGEPGSGVEAAAEDDAYDDTIVNPADLPFERRMDVCQQCHVHTPVTVLREGEDAFSFEPSEALADHAAFFRATGDIDIVSHADRLRQSACFVATRPTDRPMDCTTCHSPHPSASEPDDRNGACVSCHAASDLAERLAGTDALESHEPESDCVACHMPNVQDRAVPHGTFTDHWIRIVDADDEPSPRAAGGSPVEPYFERDWSGPDADLYRSMGEIVFATRAGDGALLRRAAGALETALAGDTTRSDAHFLLGLGYQQLGETERATSSLAHAVRETPGDPERLHALAQAYERGGRSAADVEPLYVRALESQPALAWIRAAYADFLNGQGRVEEAEREYRAALLERPSLEVAAFNLGALLASQGRRDESAEWFQTAVELDPNLTEAVSSLLEVRTRTGTVERVRSLGSPIERLAVRGRRPGAPRLIIRADSTALQVVNVPLSVSTRILKPDGTLVRVLPPGSTSVRDWDLRSGNGAEVAGGLYWAELRGESRTGAPAVLRIPFGLVRVPAD